MSNSSSTRQVVITGTGLVSPLGISVEDFRRRLAAGESGIAPIQQFGYSAAPQNCGGEVKGFDEKTVQELLPKKQRRFVKVMCREIQLAVASALLAMENARIDPEQINHERFGIDFGANLMFSPPDVLQEACWKCVDADDAQQRFHFGRWGTEGLGSLEPLWLLRYLPNMPACHIGITLDARGPSNSITLDEASGCLAVGEAFRVIQRDRADMMIAGSTGTRLHPVKTMHAALWDKLAAADAPPETWCKPFDRNRTGEVVAESAGSVILEEASHAAGRGATVLGKLLGMGASCVSTKAGKADRRAALANAMRRALADAGLEPGEIGHINAHGLGSPEADRQEAAAIRDVFGDAAASVPVTAIKSYVGNSGAGCGVIELAASLLSLQEGLVMPTLNFNTPDPDCPLNVVHGQPLAVENRTFLKLNVTRMGQAAALVVRV